MDNEPTLYLSPVKYQTLGEFESATRGILGDKFY